VHNLTIRTARNTTIDNIDVQATPSLAGYWKCDEGSGIVVKDYSQYGNDLEVFQDGPNLHFPTGGGLSHEPGFLSLVTGAGARVGITGERLISGTRPVVMSLELIHSKEGNDLWDADMGTAHHKADLTMGPYEGYMLGGQVLDYYGRITGAGGASFDQPNYTPARYPAGTVVSMNIGHVPGSRTVLSINDKPQIEALNATLVSLPAQGNQFQLYGAQSAAVLHVRNVSVWVFDVEPPLFNSTVEWMGYNPGKIPVWWEGL